jgi:hypothetical protein
LSDGWRGRRAKGFYVIMAKAWFNCELFFRHTLN